MWLPLVALSALPHRRHEHHVSRVLHSLPPHNVTLPNASFYNEARADHFDRPLSRRPKLWSQRYYVDARFWCGRGCPIFLYIGGEGPQGPTSPSLFMWTLAKRHRALMLALEHRFYGESRPAADLSLQSLALLTSAQALADLARFMSYIKAFDPSVPDRASTPPLALQAAPADSRWVTFGGSYPGNLATWLKLKYPGLTAGTVGSSAPVFAQYDFYQYGQVVGAALANPAIGGSPRCAAAVGAGVDALVAATRSGYGMHGDEATDLPAMLRPCSPLRSGVDVATYYASVFGAFQGAVQYNLQGRPPYVADLCDAVRDAGGAAAPLASLAAALALFDEDSEIRRDDGQITRDDGQTRALSTAASPSALSTPPTPPTAAATGTAAAATTISLAHARGATAAATTAATTTAPPRRQSR